MLSSTSTSLSTCASTPASSSTPVSTMTLNILSYQHQQAYAPAPGTCQAAAFHSASTSLKRSATTLSSAHRLRSRLLSQDPTTSSSPVSSSSSSCSLRSRPRSPAREALHAVVSKHLTSSSSRSAVATSRPASLSCTSSRSRGNSHAAKPAVPAAPAAPVGQQTHQPQGPSTPGLTNPHLIVATLLVRIAQANDALLARAAPLAATDRGAAALLAAAAKFQGRAPPTISLPAYAARLARYAPVPAAVWVATLIAIDRVANAPATASSNVEGTMVPPVVVCSQNVHRVLLLALSIATKVHSDAFYTNKHLAKVGGVGLPELNRLELEFLFLSGFNVNVSSAEYVRYTDRLAAYATAVQKQWAARVTTAAAAEGGVPRVHSVPVVAVPVQHHQHTQERMHSHAKSAPAALGVLISPPCSPTPSCASGMSSASTSSSMSCYSAGAVVCTAPQQKQVVWSTPPMSPPRQLMASDPIVLSPMEVDH